MKKTIISLGVASASLLSFPGAATDHAFAARSPEPLAASAAQTIPPAPTPRMQLAVIGDTLDTRSSGNLRDAAKPVPAVEPAATSGLPSTPIALASMLLIICILVGRRNADEQI